MKRSTSKIKNVPVDVYNFTTLKDLIQAAMGPPDKNIVNFKMVQAILMILARQLRMLERPVDYRSLKEDKTDRIERENAEREGREGDKGARVRDKSERESEKLEREGEKLERESEESEEDAEKKERGGGKGERDRGKREKAERDRGKREKSERDGGKVEISEIRSKKSEKDKRKGETAREKTEREGEKAGREGGERDKAETESEKLDGQTGEAEKEGDKSERDGEKGDKTERATEKSKKDRGTGKKSEKASKTSERDRGKGKKGEKERQKSERDEGEAEKAERVSEISESDAGEEEEAERKSDTSEREIDSSEIGSQRLDTESGKSQKESEKEEKIRKKEQEREKAVQKKVKQGRLKEKTGQEKEKTGQEKEKKGKEEREKTGRDKKGKKAVEEKPAIEESFISITDKDQVLVVEKIPTSQRGASQTRVGSIPVVTLSQFHILEAAVKALQQLASPIPLPSMPDNSTLRDELAKGSANLTDTMNAMQVSARVQAAEEAINRMAELLTEMAGKSGMPTAVEGLMPSLTGKPSASNKHATSTTKGVVLAKGKGTLKGAKMEGKESKRSMASMAKGPPEAAPVFVTHPQLNEALRALKEGLSQSANNMTTSANKIAEHSRTTVISAAEKAALVSHMDARIKSLTQEVNEQSELLASTDASVVTQIDAYNSQLGLVKGELKKIVEQFVTLDTNKETQAVKELNGRFEKLVEMLNVTMESNKHLIVRHNDLNSDMQNFLIRSPRSKPAIKALQ